MLSETARATDLFQALWNFICRASLQTGLSCLSSSLSKYFFILFRSSRFIRYHMKSLKSLHYALSIDYVCNACVFIPVYKLGIRDNYWVRHCIHDIMVINANMSQPLLRSSQIQPQNWTKRISYLQKTLLFSVIYLKMFTKKILFENP